jgi:Na+-transporting methylmalonyl-CoA/oxaloacetate decarboxylase gamma subunit
MTFTQTSNTSPGVEKPKKDTEQITLRVKDVWKGIAIVFVLLFLFVQFFSVSFVPRFEIGAENQEIQASEGVTSESETSSQTSSRVVAVKTVLPAEGITLPVQWGDLGVRMVTAGVIDIDKFESVVAGRGGMGEAERALLYETDNSTVHMNEQNARDLLNLLWAFGLANKNAILEDGPMQDPNYGGAGGFASTGGWTLARGNPMDHYSAHEFVSLTPEQQIRVEEVSKNIYRPCCGNSVYFPDCNHGMAMLGLLELLAVEGISEEEMYRIALQVNAYWFPDTYLTLAEYFAGQGTAWKDVDPKLALGGEYSSARGYQAIRSQVAPTSSRGGGGCGV